METIRLIKSMYPCQDVPIIDFGHGCKKPCLYCGLNGREFASDKVLASGMDDIIKNIDLGICKGFYLSPTSDCFSPENAKMSHELLERAWFTKEDIVPLVITKQKIPDKTIELLIKNKHHLVLQISVPDIDEELVKILEPGSALVTERLANIKTLTENGVKVIAVIMPWFNLSSINGLGLALGVNGVKRAIIATAVMNNEARMRMRDSENTQISVRAKWLKDGEGNFLTFTKEYRTIMLKKAIHKLDWYNIKTVVCTSDNHDLDVGELPLCTQFKHPFFGNLEREL